MTQYNPFVSYNENRSIENYLDDDFYTKDELNESLKTDELTVDEKLLLPLYSTKKKFKKIRADIEGQLRFNSGTKKGQIYINGEWVDIDTSPGINLWEVEGSVLSPMNETYTVNAPVKLTTPEIYCASDLSIGVNTNLNAIKIGTNGILSLGSKFFQVGGTGLTTSMWESFVLGPDGTNDKCIAGIYNGKAIYGAHNNSMTAWAPVYINTDDGTYGENVLISKKAGKIECFGNLKLPYLSYAGTYEKGMLIYDDTNNKLRFYKSSSTYENIVSYIANTDLSLYNIATSENSFGINIGYDSSYRFKINYYYGTDLSASYCTFGNGTNVGLKFWGDNTINLHQNMFISDNKTIQFGAPPATPSIAGGLYFEGGEMKFYDGSDLRTISTVTELKKRDEKIKDLEQELTQLKTYVKNMFNDLISEGMENIKKRKLIETNFK